MEKVQLARKIDRTPEVVTAKSSFMNYITDLVNTYNPSTTPLVEIILIIFLSCLTSLVN